MKDHAWNHLVQFGPNLKETLGLSAEDFKFLSERKRASVCSETGPTGAADTKGWEDEREGDGSAWVALIPEERDVPQEGPPSSLQHAPELQHQLTAPPVSDSSFFFSGRS